MYIYIYISYHTPQHTDSHSCTRPPSWGSYRARESLFSARPNLSATPCQIESNVGFHKLIISRLEWRNNLRQLNVFNKSWLLHFGSYMFMFSSISNVGRCHFQCATSPGFEMETASLDNLQIKKTHTKTGLRTICKNLFQLL